MSSLNVPIAVYKVPLAMKEEIRELAQAICILPHEPNQLNKQQHHELLTKLYILTDPRTILSLVLEAQGERLANMPVTAYDPINDPEHPDFGYDPAEDQK